MIWEQRISKLSGYVVAGIVGALLAVSYYNVPRLWQDEHALGTALSVAGCQEKRASLLAGEQAWVDLNCPSVRSVPVHPVEHPVKP